MLVLLVVEAEVHFEDLVVVDGGLGAHSDGNGEGAGGRGGEGLLNLNGEGIERKLGTLGQLLLLLGERDSAAIFPGLVGVVASLKLNVDGLAWSELDDVVVGAGEDGALVKLAHLRLGALEGGCALGLGPLLLDLSTEVAHLVGELLRVELVGAIVAKEHELLEHSVPRDDTVLLGSLRAFLALLGLTLRSVEVSSDVHLVDGFVLLVGELGHRDALVLEQAVESLTSLSNESFLDLLGWIDLALRAWGSLALAALTIRSLFTCLLDVEEDLRGLALDERWNNASGLLAAGDGEVESCIQILLLLDDDPGVTIVVLKVLNLCRLSDLLCLVHHSFEVGGCDFLPHWLVRAIE